MMRRAKVLTPAAIGLLIAMVSTSTPAETGADWSLQSSAAFVEAYVYACQPVEYDFAGVREPLKGASRQVHDQLFLVEYRGICHDFYYGQVVPRLPPERRPFFLTVERFARLPHTIAE
jgi:hypothetical protein